MGECNGKCAAHQMIVAQVNEEHKRTEDLYNVVDKLKEEMDVRIEKALAKQKEYLKETMRATAANTKLWMVGQAFGTATLIVSILKLTA